MFSVKKLYTVVGYVHFSVCMYTPIKRFQDSLRTGHVTDGGSAVWRVAGCRVPGWLLLSATNRGAAGTRGRDVRSPISKAGD